MGVARRNCPIDPTGWPSLVARISEAPPKALEAGADDVNGSQVPRASFAERQRTVFKTAQNNMKGLRLEYRVKTGTAGWNFHDRFLIFPKTDSGALAWSLGSSINSLGKRHHILQRVDDGQLVKDAFIELWDQLDKPEHLVWKNP